MTGTVAVTGPEEDQEDEEADVVDVEGVGDGSTTGLVIATSAVVTVPSGAVSSIMTAPVASGAARPAGRGSLPCFTSVASNENVAGPDPVQVLRGPTTSQTHGVGPLSGTTGVAVRSIWPAGTALMTRLDVPSIGTAMCTSKA